MVEYKCMEGIMKKNDKTKNLPTVDMDWFVKAVNEERWKGYGFAGGALSVGLVTTLIFAIASNLGGLLSLFFGIAAIVPTAILGSLLAITCHGEIKKLYQEYFPGKSAKEVNKLIKEYVKNKELDLQQEFEQQRGTQHLIGKMNDGVRSTTLQTENSIGAKRVSKGQLTKGIRSQQKNTQEDTKQDDFGINQ